jgi:hypothetical protein
MQAKLLKMLLMEHTSCMNKVRKRAHWCSVHANTHKHAHTHTHIPIHLHSHTSTHQAAAAVAVLAAGLCI